MVDARAEVAVQRPSHFFIARLIAERLNRLDRELTPEPQRALDDDLPIAKRLVGEDLRLFRFLELQENVHNLPDVIGAEFAILAAEVLA